MSDEIGRLHRRIDKLDSFFLWISSLSALGFSVFVTYLKMPIGPYIPIFALIAYSIAVGYVSGAMSLDSFTERIRGWSYLTLGLSLYVPLTIMKVGESQLQGLLGSMEYVAYLQMGLGLAIPLAIAFIYNRFAIGGIYKSFRQPREEVTNTILWRSTIVSFYLGSLLYISILALYNENINLQYMILYACFIILFLWPLINEEKALRGLLKFEKHQNYAKVEKKLNRKRWCTSMALILLGTITFIVEFKFPPPLIPLQIWIALFFFSITLPSFGLIIMLFYSPVGYAFTLKAKAKKELSEDTYKELQDLVKRLSNAKPQDNAKHEKKKRQKSTMKLFSVVFLSVGLVIGVVIGGGLFLMHQHAPNYSLEPGFRGFAIARNHTHNIMPYFMVVELFVGEEITLYFKYDFSVADNGSYNFIFVFPFRITSVIYATEGLRYDDTLYGSALWLTHEISDVGIGWKGDHISGRFSIANTFQSGTRGDYFFALPLFGGVGGASDTIDKLQSELRVTWHTPDTRVDLEFVVPSRFKITQAYPLTFSGPDTLEISGNRTINRVRWSVDWPDQQFTIICQNKGEKAYYDSLLFLSGLTLSVGSSIMVRSIYDWSKEIYIAK